MKCRSASLTPMLRGVWLAAVSAIFVTFGCAEPPAGPEIDPGDLRPLLVSPPGSFAQVDGGTSHSCAVTTATAAGVVKCVGYNGVGAAPAMKPAGNGSYFTQVSAAIESTCATRADGVVECFGINTAGQAPATVVPAASSFVQVSTTYFFTCATRADGVVECWGNNSYGQAPGTQMPAASLFTQVAAGQLHACAVRADGVVECWGNNVNGQAPATKTAGASSYFTDVSAGGAHTCARRADGVVECWGANQAGQTPATKTAAASYFTQVSAGHLHTCATRADGVVECWGSNSNGQAPATKSPAASSFTQVGAGAFNACARRADGVVECWGWNNINQSPARWPATFTVLPTATFNTPASVSEGLNAEISLTGAQVPGYDGSPFTYAFDCGSGLGSFSATNNASCPATDGPGSLDVKGVVKDKDGDTQEYTATITIDNVAPSVLPLSGGSILETETYTENGSFTDPGTDTYSATVDYGDGGGVQALTLTGMNFSLSHQYNSAGTFTVEVKVTDSDGGIGSASTTVTVLSLDVFTGQLIGVIEDLVESGDLMGSHGRALTNKLEAALRQIDRDNVSAAIAQMEAFIAQLTGLEADGEISAETAAILLAGAQQLLDALEAQS